MTLPPTRPARMTAYGAGMLRGDHLQIAYATNDLEQAKALFAERFGIARFTGLGGPLREGGEIHAEFAWAGGIMYELLTASGPGSEIYVERLPTDRFGLIHHHLAYLVHDAAEMAALRATIARGEWQMRVDQRIEGFMHQIFVEAPELGHLLEYLMPEPAGYAFLFETVPNN